MKKIFASFVVITLIIILAKNVSWQKHAQGILVPENIKPLSVKSYQKELKVNVTDLGISTAKKYLSSDKTISGRMENYKKNMHTRSVASAYSSRGPHVINFLDRSSDIFRWSKNIYAIDKKLFKGDVNNIIGAEGNFLLIKSDNFPLQSYPVVQSQAEKRIGFYMGKIIIIQNKSEEFENKLLEQNLPGIKKNNIEWVSGVYSISVDDFESSIDLLANLKKQFPGLLIDLDINYSIVQGK